MRTSYIVACGVVYYGHFQLGKYNITKHVEVGMFAKVVVLSSSLKPRP